MEVAYAPHPGGIGAVRQSRTGYFEPFDYYVEHSYLSESHSEENRWLENQLEEKTAKGGKADGFDPNKPIGGSQSWCDSRKFLREFLESDKLIESEIDGNPGWCDPKKSMRDLLGSDELIETEISHDLKKAICGSSGRFDPKESMNESVELVGKKFSGKWTKTESNYSSTWRELESINRILRMIDNKCTGTHIRWFTDNKNVCSIMYKGSNIEMLQSAAIQISEQIRKNNIHINMKWIPRKYNSQADYLSKQFDSDDWSINSRVFLELNRKYGPFTMDRFATDYNTKCTRFNSRWWCPGTTNINALSHSWAHETNWIVPPPNLS